MTKKLSAARLVDSLSSLKFKFAPELNDEKVRLLETISEVRILSSNKLLEFHNLLCFMRAYPGNQKIRELADRQLADFAKRIEDFRAGYGYDDDPIDDYGMVDTYIKYPYSFLMTKWLLKHFPDSIDIDWDDYSEKENDPISGLLSLFALYMENDGIDDEDLGCQDWIDEARGDNKSSLRLLVERIDSMKLPLLIKQHLYDNAELSLRWDLGRSDASFTLAAKEIGKIHFQKTEMKKARIDLRYTPRRSRPKINRIPTKAGLEIIDTQIKALLPRHRELYPVLYANPEEVYETSPGKGLQIYILGMLPEYRMPLETNYSALLIKNGVPIGYGIAVFLFERCEIAINVFDLYRSGEASVIFDHFFRVFYHNFGGRSFIMRRWQVGHENEEGLQSGSFWFYYKLGFRSIDPEIDSLARAEYKKIQKDRSYRSDLKTLKRLALSDMVIDLRPGKHDRFTELKVTDIGLAVTRKIAELYGSDSGVAERRLKSKAVAALGKPSISNWSNVEKLQFKRWAPLIGILPGLESWSNNDKKKLIGLIRARARKTEIEFVKQMTTFGKLRKAFEAVAEYGSH